MESVNKRIFPSRFTKLMTNWLRDLKGPRCMRQRNLDPASRTFGLDRGQPIDRYYIERFLQSNAEDIRGHVLEIGDDSYTRQFGVGQVTHSDVLHSVRGNPAATLFGNLETGEGIPIETFSCMIVTQTFPFIYEVRQAIRTCHSALQPGGVLLATFPGISQISRYDMDRWGDYWRFTSLSARRLFGEAFGVDNVKIETYGNVLAATSFLQGTAADELRREELDHHDPDYEVTITVRAVKPRTVAELTPS